jgi:3-oxo-5,6-didehydrosuberyl-CoA/3-oxoadipyl-CoA thiolase
MTKVITAAGIAPDEIGVWEVNLNGAAVALGHPFGASGTRYLLSLAISMRERNARYGVLGLCAGSGRGMAVLLENSQRT